MTSNDPTAGTGPGGSFTAADLRRTQPPGGAALAPSNLGATRTRPRLLVTYRSRFAVREPYKGGTIPMTPADVEVDVFGLNPLLEEAKKGAPNAFSAARRVESTPPTCFRTGDLPLFLTSGADPTVLMQLPWIVRHAAARANGQELTDLLDAYGGADLDTWRAAERDHMGDAGVLHYAGRVSSWLIAGEDRGVDNPSPALAAAQRDLEAANWRVS